MHLYEEIEAYLLEQIRSGHWKEGDQIPREVDLAKQFQVSRPTVRQAFTRLTTKGLIIRIKKKGSFVAPKKLLNESTQFLSSYRGEMQKRGLHAQTKVLKLEIVDPPVYAAEALNLSPERSVLFLSRLRSVEELNDARPAVFTNVWIPSHLAAGLEEYDFSNASLYDTMDSLGISVVHVRREIEIRSADSSLAKLLHIEKDSPVFFLTSIGYLEDRTPVEYSESYYPADTSKFLVELRR